MRYERFIGDELIRVYENVCLAAEEAARTAAQKLAIAATVKKANAKAKRAERRRGHRK